MIDIAAVLIINNSLVDLPNPYVVEMKHQLERQCPGYCPIKLKPGNYKIKGKKTIKDLNIFQM